MERKEKEGSAIDSLVAQLRGDNPLARQEAEAALRGLEAPPPALVESLLETLRDPQSGEPLQRCVVGLLVDVKFSALVPLLGEALLSEQRPDRLAALLSIAWQSRLDFSPLLPALVQHVASEHLAVAIEAMTALEIAAERAAPEQLRDLAQRLKALQRGTLPPHTAALVSELYSTTSTTLQQKVNAAREAKARGEGDQPA